MKILIMILFILIVIIVIGLGFIGNYFYNLAINPNTPKDMIFGSPSKQKETSGKVDDTDINWVLDNSNYSHEYIISSDGLRLHSYKILNNNPSNKWVITVHGYTSEGIVMSSYAKNYYDMGYNILIPDLRGHASSEGNYIGMGWDDRFDIISWINYLLSDNKNCKIVLHGVSMGAATVAMVSGENLSISVKAIIADCGYTSVWEQFGYQLKKLFSLPKFPILHVSSLVCKIRAGYSIKDASAINQVKKSKTPILYIHGDKDAFVPYYMMEELYSATSSDKNMVTIKDAAHAKSSEVNPKTYWTSIYDFINKYMD